MEVCTGLSIIIFTETLEDGIRNLLRQFAGTTKWGLIKPAHGWESFNSKLIWEFLRKQRNCSAENASDIALRQSVSITQIKVGENSSAGEVLEIAVGEKLALTE